MKSKFLDCLKILLDDDGFLYLTTPNMRSVSWFHMFWKDRIIINPDHTCWFDPTTLEILLKQSGLKLHKIFYHGHTRDKENAKDLGVKYEKWMARRIYAIVKKETK